MGPIGRLLSGNGLRRWAGTTDHPLPYSWILANKLAVGPMPRTESHWKQLEEAGLKSRFSCCYPQEEVFAPVPDHWITRTLSLPDHREQESLRANVLEEALKLSWDLIQNSPPLYVHCYAGRERSALIAVGLTARLKCLDVFTALDWVRRSHPSAAPLYAHLVILEQVLEHMA